MKAVHGTLVSGYVGAPGSLKKTECDTLEFAFDGIVGIAIAGLLERHGISPINNLAAPSVGTNVNGRPLPMRIWRRSPNSSTFRPH